MPPAVPLRLARRHGRREGGGAPWIVIRSSFSQISVIGTHAGWGLRDWVGVHDPDAVGRMGGRLGSQCAAMFRLLSILESM